MEIGESYKEAYFQNLHLLNGCQKALSDLRASKVYKSELDAKSNEIVRLKGENWQLKYRINELETELESKLQ